MTRFAQGMAVVLAIAGRDVGAADEKVPAKEVTFNKDIAPIVFQHCAACHRPGEVAPFSLLSYRDVQKRARLIRDLTANRTMPPWKAVPEHLRFKDERRLSDAQIALVRQWVDEGAVEGDAKDLPAAPKFAAGWQLGEPDMVVRMPKAFTIPAEGRDLHRNFVIPLKVPDGKYLRAIEYRPENRGVVHHAILSMDPTGKLRERDGQDGAPGYTQVAIPGRPLTGNLAFWVPGKESRPLPDGVAIAWPSGADLVLQLHLHPSGKVEVEQSTIGLYFTDEAPRRSLDSVFLQTKKIDIPPGEKEYRTRSTALVGRDADVHGIFPHMHLIGKQVRVTAKLPDGSEKSLLRIDDWDFNWQIYYEYASTLTLPRGTQIILECTHDNSADNPNNPNQPPQRVLYGEQTTNEMSACVLHLLPKDGGPATVKAIDAADVIRRFDRNNDGKLSRDELLQIPGIPAEQLDAALRRFDRDGDGVLSEGELAEAIRAIRSSGR